MNKNNAMITIKGMQKYDYDSDKTELMTDGTFEKKGDNYFISYNESEMTGMDGAMTLITVEDDDTVTMLRTGGFTSAMVFNVGKRNLCHYETPEGDFTITASARKIINRLNENGGTLSLNYSLDFNNEHMSDNNVFIKIIIQ